ncbi:PfkB family carbohydrate kinase [Empedobacter stercoris]|uniref:PfkB family carbohydrate kinase n=2 Tax=Empedobacter TaxID=59734 RepID=A0ABY8V5H1_9FLAO|nr:MULTISPECIES: PfkB family carbohydrate kinase [Empedobacter]MCA4777917.1 bifunctional hydroxymethylpyrimidine kinase/phosphomethylpyrimidine kinase [Empedobacter stercoris]MCA4782477.1 bifunctional hydroxymethylpyrimidine kinase/phosphomethylpyrimidine kinase [Empedobacter stercoris]MCA4809873.1 bifunctional hydroxymethylpyrimidine kinase/phosphomethylpyrimidine kinase [Empedobacter stercoris]NOJ75969.1 sugar kinase [Empedobacter stercoris]QNT15042.1 sugar kinase [Empedobacter stercoris]
MSLLTVGTVAFDKLESPFGKTDKILGGAATYIGMASSLLGVDTAIVSVVGGDFPQKYIDLLRSKGINLDGMEIVKDGKTFFWEGKYHNDLNTRDTLATELNVLETFNPVVPQTYKSPDVLMLGNLHPLVQKGVLTQLDQRPGLVVLDTMNFWMDCAWDELMDVIKDVDVISINDEEARQMSGEYSLVKAAKKIMTFGPKTVIIKKGEHGALLFQDEQVFFAPALPLEDVFDPTGAGDTFAGGFSGYLAKTNDFSFDNMKRAIVYGSALASVTCEKFGTESLEALDREGLIDRLRKFHELMDFSINL